MFTPAAAVRHALVLLTILALSCAVRAAEPTAKPKTAQPEVDPQAQRVIDAWGKYFAGLRGFAYDSKISLVVERQGQKQSQEFKLKLSAERPNKLAFAVEATPDNGATITSDGNELAVYIKAYQKYGVDQAPATFDAMLQNPLVGGPLNFGNAAVVTLAVLNDDPAKKLVEKTESVTYGGVVELDGVKCHLLEAASAEVDWKLWIDEGDKPLVRQFVPDLAKAFARMAATSKQKSPFDDMKITNTVTFTNWQVDPKFAEDTFAFQAPEGAEKVDSLMDILTGGRPRQEPAPHPLVGQPAPDVKLDLLEGGSLDLASLKGKKVVILDFWATWCGPCVQAMPIIEKVAAKYKDKGVALYAVNLQEEPDEVKKFLEEAELKVDVALDKDGDTAKAYLAEAIPQTVIVGKDGSVQVVRVGLSPNLEEALEKDLESLVAGKDLASETLKTYQAKKEAAAKGTEAAQADAAGKDKKPDDAGAKKKSGGLNISVEKSGAKKTGTK